MGKKIVRKIHLWCGLASGAVVFIVAVTGCFYAFEYELRELFQAYRHIEPENAPLLPPSRLLPLAEAAFPGHTVHSIAYGDAADAAQVIFYEPEPLVYAAAYLNPYTGEVLHVQDFTREFFWVVLQGHYYLWLPPAVGQPLVAWATVIFFLMLITGIVLWWPKNRHARKQRFRFTWKESTRWRRKNYDLHTVLGFYAWVIALVFALTGLVWGFPWFAYGVHRLAGGEKNLQWAEPESPSFAGGFRATASNEPMDKLWVRLMEQYPEAAELDFHIPHTDSSSIYVNLKRDENLYWRSDYRFYDASTLDEIPVKGVYGSFENADGADKLLRMNYDIHTGAILGFPGKILAFGASAIIASLPVTGVIIYFGRRKKKKKS